MKLNANLSDMKFNISWPHLRKVFFRFLFRRAKIFLFLIAISVFAYCVYIWYDSIYASSWSESQKQEYMNNKEKGVIFNRKGFEEIVEDAARRADDYQKTIEIKVDIFRLKS